MMQEEIEGNVKYTIDYRGPHITLDVENLTDGNRKTEVYECVYTPVCGYDAFDINEVEAILDKMIKGIDKSSINI